MYPLSYRSLHSWVCLWVLEPVRIWSFRLSGFGPCMIAAVEDSEIPIFPLASLVPHLQELEILASASTITISISAHQVYDVWMCLPFHLITALGWDAESPDFPPTDGRSCCFTLSPRPTLARMPVDLMHGQWRIWFLVAQLEAAMSDGRAEGVQVEVQLVARRLWTGLLPRTLTLSSISAMWQTACARCHLPMEHRVFSGPFPCGQELSLSELVASPHHCVIRKSGHLLVTVHPEMHGGGAKSESLNWAKTRTASLCLAQGIDLSGTTLFVDTLSDSVGAQRLTQTLQDAAPSDKWTALSELASSAGVPVPVASNQQARAANRASKAMQRRKTQARKTVCAADVQLCPDFFVNEDGTPVTILDTIQPGMSGLKLLDEPEAASLLHTLRGVQPDELGLLILGHSCPSPDECNGQLCFPVTARACGSRLLLAGCLHNVGGRRIKAREHGDIQVVPLNAMLMSSKRSSGSFSPRLRCALLLICSRRMASSAPSRILGDAAFPREASLPFRRWPTVCTSRLACLLQALTSC